MSTTPEQQPTEPDRPTPAADDVDTTATPAAPVPAPEPQPERASARTDEVPVPAAEPRTERGSARTDEVPAPTQPVTGAADPLPAAPTVVPASADSPADDDASGAGRGDTVAPTTPGRGAHLQSRRAPVAPEPDEDEVLPRLATPDDGAPTATLPAVDALDAPLTDPAHDGPAGTAAGPVRRTSFRTERESSGAAAPDPFAATPPPAPVSPPYGTDLPGTGPSDDQVPPGDAEAPAPEPVIVPAPAAPEAEPLRRSREPRAGGIGRLLLGLLTGLLAGTVGIWLVVFGQSRILGVQAPDWDASYDPLGVVLVTVGVLVLVALVGAGLWSTAAPLTAGLLATVIGVVYLYVPATTHADTVSLLASDGTRRSVERAVVAATSGTLFVVGALLLAVGIAFAAANRRRLPRA